MIKIAHRGNLYGKNPSRENDPEYVLEALGKGYHVEVDVRSKDGELYLGHDEPKYPIRKGFLLDENIICNIKDSGALEIISGEDDIHHFWHESDEYTITSKGWKWVYPKKELVSDSVCVLPEVGYSGVIYDCKAICSDHAGELHKIIK